MIPLRCVSSTPHRGYVAVVSRGWYKTRLWVATAVRHRRLSRESGRTDCMMMGCLTLIFEILSVRVYLIDQFCGKPWSVTEWIISHFQVAVERRGTQHGAMFFSADQFPLDFFFFWNVCSHFSFSNKNILHDKNDTLIAIDCSHCISTRIIKQKHKQIYNGNVNQMNIYRNINQKRKRWKNNNKKKTKKGATYRAYMARNCRRRIYTCARRIYVGIIFIYFSPLCVLYKWNGLNKWVDKRPVRWRNQKKCINGTWKKVDTCSFSLSLWKADGDN